MTAGASPTTSACASTNATSRSRSEPSGGIGDTVALTCLLLPAGAIRDRYGRRGAVLAGLVIFSLGSMATGDVCIARHRSSRVEHWPVLAPPL